MSLFAYNTDSFTSKNCAIIGTAESENFQCIYQEIQIGGVILGSGESLHQ